MRARNFQIITLHLYAGFRSLAQNLHGQKISISPNIAESVPSLEKFSFILLIYILKSVCILECYKSWTSESCMVYISQVNNLESN